MAAAAGPAVAKSCKDAEEVGEVIGLGIVHNVNQTVKFVFIKSEMSTMLELFHNIPFFSSGLCTVNESYMHYNNIR